MDVKSNKLISVIDALERAQLRRCRKFIQSPFVSGNNGLLVLFDEIVAHQRKKKLLDKQALWPKITAGKKPYDDVRFRKFTSDLFKLIKKFLIQESLAEEEEIQNYLYLLALEKLQPEKILNDVKRNWSKLADFDRGYDHQLYLYHHLLESRKYSLFNYMHKLSERANLEEISNSLDVYFIVIKLDIALQVQTQAHNQRFSYDLNLIPEIIRFLDENTQYGEIPIVSLYYNAFKMLTANDTHEAFYKYKSLMLDETLLKNSSLAFNITQPALNYCRRRINEGNRDFLAEYLEVYRFGLERDLVFDDGVLDPLQFRNTILTALRLGDYDWAVWYIENYQDRLPEKQRSNAVNYNMATLYFYQKRYDDALGFLRDVEYENTTYNLNAKTMLLAIYYETKEGDVLDSLFDSTIAYLNRHKEIPEINRQAYRNLVLFTRRLTRLAPGDRKAVEQLRADLAEQRYVASRPWLEEKIAEFAGS